MRSSIKWLIIVFICMLVGTQSLYAQNIAVTGKISSANLSVTGTVEGATLSGALSASAQASITQSGILNSLTVTNGINANSLTATANISAATISAVHTTGAQPNITGVGTLSNLTVTNGINANSLTATANISAATISAVHTTGAQPNITGVGTLSNLTVTNGITANSLTATANVSAATLSGVLTTSSQPNVTSLGLLTAESYAGANVNLSTTVGTFTSACPTVLTAGTWLITGNVTIGFAPGATTYISVTVLLGSAITTVYASGEASTRNGGTNNSPLSITLTKIITLASTTTVNIYATAGSSSAAFTAGQLFIASAPPDPGTGSTVAGTGTSIHAIRIK